MNQLLYQQIGRWGVGGGATFIIHKKALCDLLSLDLCELICWSLLLLWTEVILGATVRTVSSAHHPSPVLRDVIITNALKRKH
jgi:hypothetical protein